MCQFLKNFPLPLQKAAKRIELISVKELSDWNPKTDPDFLCRDVLAFDLDDTLTEASELHADILCALEKVAEKGFLRVLVTGRSAGWADAIIKLLPFDAVVAENGAILRFWPRRKANRAPREKARELFWNTEGYQNKPPLAIRAKHDQAIQKILKEVPGVAVASDQSHRVYDLAIDFCEEVNPPLSLREAEKIKALFEEMGAVAKVSSIHVNGWWGNFSKREGLIYLFEKVYSKDIDKNLVYVGDSPNDAPLFSCAAVSVGVANVRNFDEIDFERPRYVCRHEAGRGSLELIEHVLKFR